MIIDPNDIPFQEVHKLMIGSIVPRPIALVSTISKSNNYNLAPFSYKDSAIPAAIEYLFASPTISIFLFLTICEL